MIKNKKILIFFIFLAIILLIIFGILFLKSNIHICPHSQSNQRNNTTKQIEILAEYINLRENNTTQSEIIGKVYKNEIYNVIDTNGLWVKIQTSQNLIGWIISSYKNDIYIKYLEVNGNIPEEQLTLDKIAKNESLDFKKNKYNKIEWISDVPLSEIKCIKYNGMVDIQPNMFITKSGELYEFSTQKIYSNEQVCKKIDTDIKFDRFHLFANDRDLSIIISLDNKYYYYYDGKFQNYSYIINSSLLHKINDEHKNNFGLYDMGQISYDIYYYIEGNNVYEYKLKYTNNGNKELVSETIIDTLPENENFVSLEGRIIKTNTSFYKIGIKNQEECNKYEDITPIYGLVKLENISSEYDKISYFNGNYIIYKDDPKNLYIYRQ